MNKINLRPQNFGTPYDTVADIEGVVYTIEGNATITVHTNYLENKEIVGWYVLNKEGFGDVFLRNITRDSFEVVRETTSKMQIVVY